MREVWIVGIGATPVREHWDRSLRDLAWEAMEKALNEAAGLRPQALFVGNMFGPLLSRQAHLATLLADYAGFAGIEAVTVEAASASGAAALRQAYLAVASGALDTALVVGVEKMTDKVGTEVEWAMSTLLDADYEAEPGLTPAAQAAWLMQLYRERYDAPEDAFMPFALLAHQHGVGNPYAMFRRAIGEKHYRGASVVSPPLTIFDMAPYADGAAAVFLAARDLLPPQLPQRPVRIAGSAAATDTLALHDRQDPLAFEAARASFARALQQAGIAREDVDFFEPFDLFAVYVPLTLEAVGFAAPGTAWEDARHRFGLDGHLPILTLGGQKARGFPGAASGVYQVVEAVWQLRGQAGDNQIPQARWGVVQALGGPASTAFTHVLAAASPEAAT